MKNIGVKIFAYIAVVLMLASIAPAMAVADTDNLQDRIQERDRVNLTMDASNDGVQNQIRQVMNTQERYGEATENFLRIKANNSALNTEEAIEATKEYLNSTIDVMIESLENEEYIEKLNEEKEDIAAATTRAELAECAQDIREIWREARDERTSSTTTSINNKLTAVMRISETMTLRLENEIARIEKNGEDVTGLQEMLVEYKAHIAEAREYQEQAMIANTNRERQSQGFQNMKQAGLSIKEANAVLGDMLTELKQYREGLVTLSADETLTAEGDGTAVLSGDFVLSFNADDAILVVKDMDGDAKVDTEGASYGYSNVDAGNSDINNRAFVYHNLTGDVTIEGTRLTITLRGTDISLDVAGNGSVMFTGNGTYELNGEESKWTASYVEEEKEAESEDETPEPEEQNDI
ncbi:hypothetical protein RE476_05595 [Methanolobus mangrovi]|uniref:Uncharacterized protein n=1 Tax=Methanolobus mangrovi TaxID=3072977 RepID=A0AA51YK48_9EURY|nr:hypothetical protein [Methanolobus mangrovi]WMW23300.1 hypothetical protein RE476_05595 [Methanolobus mangrovi]